MPLERRPVGDIATWNTDRDRCPGKTCEGPCPRTGCVCPPCNCAVCQARHARACRASTPLRARAATPVKERLFDPEPTPIRDHA